eukprot:INCI587.2.p1 GENE.INCI587.2~~INCI587.2.p1  ORF type:complete len:1174 (+),score=262.66 INCI587.2:211-3522(+)
MPRGAAAAAAESEMPSLGEFISVVDRKWEAELSKVAASQVPSGAIVCVRVHNLMLRGGATIHFSPRFNFITGRNGTGKSRIVVAVQLALGARSSETGRGSNLNEFICNSGNIREAKIEVILYNGGKNPFKPEKYGKYFAISRTLRRGVDRSRVGSSPFSIQYTDPETTRAVHKVSDSQANLKQLRDDFLQAVHIKPSNPMVILTQQESKKMLDSKDPASLYQIFLQATNLQSLGDRFEAVDKQIAQCKDLTKRLVEQIALRKDTIRRLEQRLASLDENSDLQNKIKLLEQRLVLREAQDMRTLVNKKKVALEVTQLKLQELKDERSKLLIQAGQYDGPLEEERRKMALLEEQKTQISREVNDKIQAQKSKLKREFNQIKHLIQENRTEAHASKNNFASIRQKLKAEEKRQSKNSTSNTRALSDINSDLELAEEQKADIKDNILPKLRLEEAAAEKKYKAHLDEETRLQRQCDGKSSQIKRLETELRNCGTSNDPFAVVKAAIARENFDFPPIGPLYSHLEVDEALGKQQYGSDTSALDAVESFFRRELTTFLVGSSGDAELLRRVLGQTKHSFCNVVHVDLRKEGRGGYRKRRWSVQAPDIPDLSLAKAVKIEDDAIYNYITDTIHFQKVFICDSIRRAQQVVQTQKNPTAKSALDPDGPMLHKLLKGRALTKSYHRVDKAKYLKPSTNMTQTIKESLVHEKEELRKLRSSHQEMQGVKRKVAADLRSAKGSVNREEKRVEKLSLQIRRLAKERQEALKVASSEEQDVLESIRNELNEVKNEMDILEERHLELLGQKDEINTAFADFAAEAEKDLDDISQQIEEQGKVVKRLEAAKSKSASDTTLKKKERDIGKVQTAIEKTEGDIRDEEAKLQERLEILIQSGEDVNAVVKESMSRIQTQLEKARALSDRQKEEAGIDDGKSITDLQAEMEAEAVKVGKAEIAKKEARRRLKQLEINKAGLDKSKRTLFMSLRKMINTQFDKFLLEGNSTGTFTMDVTNETLDISITTKVGHKTVDDVVDDATSHLHKLSGGEKTKTMMAFLLAIIRSSPSPWFIMDEVRCFPCVLAIRQFVLVGGWLFIGSSFFADAVAGCKCGQLAFAVA